MTVALVIAKPLLEEIRAALRKYLLQEERTELRSCEPIEVFTRSYSTIHVLKVETSRGRRRYVAKTTAQHPDNRTVNESGNQAVVEYGVLQRLHRCYARIDKCSVPRPVLVLPDSETYVMDFVEGDVLSSKLCGLRYFYPRSQFRLLGEHFHSCGRWLRHFQRCTAGTPGGPKILTGVLDHCNTRLQFIDQIEDRRCPKGLRHDVMTFLKGELAKLSGATVQVAGRHGDFGSWNVLASPEGITVMDFFGYQEGPVCLDPLSMLLELECLRRCLPASPARVELLKAHFVKGLGVLPRVHQSVLLICEALLRLISLYGCLQTKGEGPSRRIQKRLCLKDNLEWLQTKGTGGLLWPAEAIV